mgnify:CR=1 FL=1
MSVSNLEGVIKSSIEKIREMVDVETIIGDPITTPEGVTIIPVSKVTLGVASGGSDLPSKQAKDLFGGGVGCGVTIQPLAFITISNGDVKLLQLSMNASKENAMINMVPEVIDKITSAIKSKSAKGETEAVAE